MSTTQPDAQLPPADLGIIGGSGFYTFLNNPERVTVDTPYGAPSAPIAVGEVNGRRVAFVPRHGEHHELPPHQVNYRANLWALRSLGVRQVLATCAVGSLKAELTPGTDLRIITEDAEIKAGPRMRLLALSPRRERAAQAAERKGATEHQAETVQMVADKSEREAKAGMRDQSRRAAD